MDRRDFVLGVATGVVAAAAVGMPAVASAKPASTWFYDDSETREPSQQATDGRLDLNSAFVVSAHIIIY